MSKALIKIGTIVAAAGLIYTGVGALALGGLAGTLSVGGISVATITAVGSGLAAIGSMTAKAPKTTNAGDQTEWKLESDAGIPYPIGRTYTAGVIRHIDAYGSKRIYRSIVIVYGGAGPIQGFESFQADDAPVNFAGAGATGYYAGWMWLSTQLGQAPEAAALTPPFPGFPKWGPSSKLSGYAASILTLKYDKDGKVYSAGTPKFGAVLNGVRVYDARQDSTYPGGDGPCRFGDEATYVGGGAANNPWCHALTYAIGRRQNGKLVIGVGLPRRGIDIAAYVAAANVADANGWTIGGVTYDVGDGAKWNNLKQMCQAGGGEPIHVGAKLSCKVSAPRVSIGNLTANDLADGRISIPAMLSRRERINGIVPRYRSEANKWEIVPANVIRVAAYVEQDKGQRTKEVEYALCQDVDQAAQLAAYDIVNAREFGPIVIPCKPRMWYYRPGDAITLTLPDQGLDGQLAVILNRKLNVATGAVELTLASETLEKHAFALGMTGIAPPTPSLTDPADLDQAVADDRNTRASFTLRAQTVAYPVTSDDDSIMVEAFTGTLDDGRVIAFPAATLDGLASGMAYVLLYDLAAGAYLAVAEPATVEIASPAYVQIRFVSTSEGGVFPATPTPPGGDGGGGGGSGCPIITSRILLANAERTGPGETIAAGDIEAGHWVWAQRESEAGSSTWGAYLVTFTRVFESDLYQVAGKPQSSPSHLWWTAEGWARSDVLGTPAGRGKVVALTVAEAHTYALVGDRGQRMLSHNKIPTQTDA